MTHTDSDILLSRSQTAADLFKGGVLLSWSTAEGLKDQHIHYTTKKSSDKKFFVIDVEDDATSYHFKRPELSLNETYLFKVVSSTGKSNTLEVIFVSDRPDKPIFVDVVALDTSLKFKMQMGASNGSVVSMIKFLLSNGTDIFSVQRPINSLNEYTLDADDGISNYEIYEVASCVMSSRGCSDLSDGVTTQASDYPNVAQNISVDESDRRVVLSWNKPSDFAQWEGDFVAVHLRYKEMSKATFNYIRISDSSLLSHTLDHLVNGTNYHFQLAYENDYGLDELHSIWSALIVFSPFGIPTAPELVSINGIQATSMRVRFATTTNLNGLDLYKYWVSFISNGVLVKKVDGEAPGSGEHEIVVDNLTKGQDYNISVSVEGRKDKADGTQVSLESGQSNSLTRRPFSKPSAVLELTSSAFVKYVNGYPGLIDSTIGTQLIIDHIPPENNGGFEIVKYIVTLLNGGNVITKEYVSTPVVVDGLLNGVAYDISVRAYTMNTIDNNSLIEGDITSYVPSFVPDTSLEFSRSQSVPGNIPMKIPLVTNYTITELDRKLKVVWEEPLDGGSAITKYFVQAKPKVFDRNQNDGYAFMSGWLSSTTREWTSPMELINGLEYIVTIAAWNQIPYNNGDLHANRGIGVYILKNPFGPQSFVDEPMLNGKSITFKINPNGRPVKEYHLVAFDNDGDDNNGNEQIYLKTSVANTEKVQVVEFTKIFTTLTGSISKYLIIAESSVGSSVHKTSFTDVSAA